MHVILGTAVLDDARGLRKFKPSAHLAGCTSVTPESISIRGLVMFPLNESYSYQGTAAATGIKGWVLTVVSWPKFLFLLHITIVAAHKRSKRARKI